MNWEDEQREYQDGKEDSATALGLCLIGILIASAVAMAVEAITQVLGR